MIIYITNQNLFRWTLTNGTDIISLVIVWYFVRSAHGFSDTDMNTLLEQLQSESDDLCGHRGLTPGKT